MSRGHQMRISVATLTALMLLAFVSSALADETSQRTDTDTTSIDSLAPAATPTTEQVVVYYLHMNRRCATCNKLEAYSQQALATGFAESLKDSSLVWQVVNFEQEGNEHFAEDYRLFSQSLILSRQVDGDETEWRNLDQIWKLVGDKEKFIAYVQTEVSRFLSPPVEE